MLQLMSWLPKESLRKSFELAGIEIEEDVEQDNGIENVSFDKAKNIKEDVDSIATSALPTNKFTLVGRPDALFVAKPK